jgi:hypothetical protein
MGILRGLIPFLAFALLNRVIGTTGALAVGALAAAGLVAHGWRSGASPKILELGTLVLFATLAGVTLLIDHPLSVIGARLWVDLGLLAIILVSMALRQPFTMQYAKESVPREHWDSPRFLRVNMVITAGWAAAILAMVIAEAAVVFIPGVPHQVATVVIIGALVGAVAFTRRQTEAA